VSDYLADERPIDESEFRQRACDPRASVVVEACAGSGKTWLLVGRIVRALLDGAAPGQILAITFTRRAAQEMRARLLKDLQDLAQATDAAVADWLHQRGMAPDEACAAIGPARGLYERVVAARLPMAIETFHGWFWQLAAGAPLGAGVPYAPALLEAVDRVRLDAWLHFSAQLVRPEHAAQRAAWEWLLDEIGEDSARQLLMQLLSKRAEWWSFAGDDEDAAVVRALAPLRAAGDDDPRVQVRQIAFVAAMQSLLDVLRSLDRPGDKLGEAIERAERWLGGAGADAARDFADARSFALTQKDTPRDILLPEKIGKKLPAHASRYAEAHAVVVGRLQQLLAAHRTWRALKLNEAALACGRLLIAAYQRLKAQQQALDFTDLEWHAHRLLADPDHAAYMQVRLDARYRHILVDEFQDTNPLQWQVLQSWLAAYGELDAGEAEEGAPSDRPSVFIVGDPKQSIYRFRRAEPRVFNAAIQLLCRDFGATHLRTNVTRRNARAVIDVLNLSMPANPLYQPQSTRAKDEGAFVLLPLAPAPAAPRREGDDTMRDVLTTPRAERDTETRYREGRVLANEILHWVADLRVQGDGGERAARFSDVLLLVRRRTHLDEYERALRDGGVPFVSDRRGGLLETLEADDLTALLEFLTTPSADLRLARALRSPIFGCSDDDLIRIAQAPGATWWQRLQSLETSSPASAGEGRGEDAGLLEEAPVSRVKRLLTNWLTVARFLPVHDLLDRIIFEGDVRRRYAAVAPAALHTQVQANLDAFIELALAIDAGRYPSLPRFIDELAGLKRHAPEEAPDQGLADVGDAVRVMTIHGAKGLEADIVALADVHVRPAAADAGSVLVVWPPQAAAPEHVSLVARGEQGRDDARATWFAEDDAQREQEDWNLLYVGATRAKQVLIASGAEGANPIKDETWYTRLEAAAALSRGAAEAQPRPPAGGTREVRDFRPEPLPTGRRVLEVPETDAQRLGRAWHALLEQREGAFLEAIAQANGLSAEQAALAAAAAERVRSRLPHFFAGSALTEVELVAADGELLRVDRLVEQEDALWIIDFKWRITDAELTQYEAQVRRYADVLRAIRQDKPVRLGLVTADGELVEVKE
jgi:ATP-dependent helicase/nuclease subunit A